MWKTSTTLLLVSCFQFERIIFHLSISMLAKLVKIWLFLEQCCCCFARFIGISQGRGGQCRPRDCMAFISLFSVYCCRSTYFICDIAMWLIVLFYVLCSLPSLCASFLFFWKWVDTQKRWRWAEAAVKLSVIIITKHTKLTKFGMRQVQPMASNL